MNNNIVTDSTQKEETHRVYQRRLQSRTHLIESFKAKIDKKRTRLERYADVITDFSGSNKFLFLNVIWFAIWILLNVHIIPGIAPFDPFPFGLLTSIVSLEAIILAILVLISQNRSAKIADLREEVHLQIDIIAEEEITKIMEMIGLLLEKNNIDVSKDKQLHSMLNPTNPDKIKESISEQLR